VGTVTEGTTGYKHGHNYTGKGVGNCSLNGISQARITGNKCET